jgi:hypothetical protein
MQEQSFFVFGRDGHLFSGGFEKIPGGGRNFAAGLPPPGSDTPHTLVGGVISSAVSKGQASHFIPYPKQPLQFKGKILSTLDFFYEKD